MVRVGKYSLTIVDATTLVPLQEYTNGVDTWVAGNPGDEFFVDLTSHQKGSNTVASIDVDTVNIGYDIRLSSEGPQSGRLGPLKSGQVLHPGSTPMVHAFRFRTPQTAGEGSSQSFGAVEAVWNLTKYTGIPADRTHTTHAWAGAQNAVAPDGKKQGVGALASTSGSTPIRLGPWAETIWSTHDEVARAKICYCEPFGLVARGILKSMPGDWSGTPGNDQAQGASSSSATEGGARPKRMRRGRVKTEAGPRRSPRLGPNPKP